MRFTAYIAVNSNNEFSEAVRTRYFGMEMA